MLTNEPYCKVLPYKLKTNQITAYSKITRTSK